MIPGTSVPRRDDPASKAEGASGNLVIILSRVVSAALAFGFLSHSQQY